MKRQLALGAVALIIGFISTLIQTVGTGATPTLFIAGDSTAGNGAANGWGSHLQDYFDPHQLIVINRARGGRSSRTFITEGLWDALVTDLKAGDYVLIQFGHNDAGPINDNRRRGFRAAASGSAAGGT